MSEGVTVTWFIISPIKIETNKQTSKQISKKIHRQATNKPTNLQTKFCGSLYVVLKKQIFVFLWKTRDFYSIFNRCLYCFLSNAFLFLIQIYYSVIVTKQKAVCILAILFGYELLNTVKRMLFFTKELTCVCVYIF